MSLYKSFSSCFHIVWFSRNPSCSFYLFSRSPNCCIGYSFDVKYTVLKDVYGPAAFIQCWKQIPVLGRYMICEIQYCTRKSIMRIYMSALVHNEQYGDSSSYGWLFPNSYVSRLKLTPFQCAVLIMSFESNKYLHGHPCLMQSARFKMRIEKG